jgi:hypothetical protein
MLPEPVCSQPDAGLADYTQVQHVAPDSELVSPTLPIRAPIAGFFPARRIPPYKPNALSAQVLGDGFWADGVAKLNTQYPTPIILMIFLIL